MPTTTTGIATSFIQFSRPGATGGGATVTDSDGKIKWAPHNLLLNSEGFDASSWVKANATIAANSAVAPNGTTTADKMYPTINGSGRGVSQRVLVDGLTNYSVSIYAKAAGKNFIAFTDLTAADYRAWVNLSTGAKTETAGYFVTVTDAGNGWYNCVFTQTATAANPYAYVVVCDADSSVAVTVNGTDGVYLWGAALYRSDLAMQPNTSAYPLYNPTTPKNLMGYTEDFSNAAWQKLVSGTGVLPVVTADYGLAPNGLQVADRVQFDLGATPSTAFSRLFQSTSTTLTKAVNSVYLKTNDGSTKTLYLINSAGSTIYLITVTGEWQRFDAAPSASSATGQLQFGLSGASSGVPVTTSTTADILAWGAQLSDSASLDTYSPVYGARITSAAYYGPRRDFDGATLACKGLLVEESRTNLALQSAAFDNGSWAKSALNTTGTPQWVNAAISPDGTMTADKLIPDTSSTNAHLIQSNSPITVANATAHTWSVYAKADGYDWIAVVAYNDSFSRFTWFNVATGAVGTNAPGNTAHPPVAVGNGWYRLSVTRTTTNTVAYYILYAANGDNQPTFAGDGTKGVLVWGAQLEAGSFPTSQIPTGAAQATRAGEDVSVSPQSFPYSGTEGTIVANFLPFALSGALGVFSIHKDATSSDNRIDYRTNGGNLVTVGGADQGMPTAGTPSVNVANKFAVGYKLNDYASSLNSGTVATDSTAAVPPMDAFTIGKLASSNYLNGYIRQITYLPRRVSNAELQTRTA